MSRPRWVFCVVRTAAAACAVVALLSISGCIFFFNPNAFRTISAVNDLSTAPTPDANVPEVDVIVNAAGGDAVKVYLESSASDRFRLAEAAASWLGASGTPAVPDPLDENTATVQLGRRLISRTDGRWTLEFDTSGLDRSFAPLGYDVYYLFICHPAVEARFDTSYPPDFPADITYCYHGNGWTLSSDHVLRGTLTLIPETSDYLRYGAAVVLGTVVLGGVSWFVGDRLRRGPFRRRNAVSVAIGLIAGGFLAVAAMGSTIGIGVGLGPADNLALAKDLPQGAYGGSVAGPAVLALIPGVLLAILLVRKRPWPAEPVPEEWRPWPVPPPPGSTPGAPPPPLPGVRR